MFKKYNLNYAEPYHRSMKKTNAEEDMNNDCDNDNIDDCLVNFGISDDDLEILLNEVTKVHNPSFAAKRAIEGVDQKGLANLLTRIFAIAIKNRTGPKSFIPAAFDLISEILDISALASSEHGQNPILNFCLKNLEKMFMSGDFWEELPNILADTYVRWDLKHCVGEILVKWLEDQSVDELTMEDEKLVIRRRVKSCRTLLSKIGGQIWSDLPGRFVQLQQMAKRLLLGEDCRNREELLEIVILLSAVNEREAIVHEEEGKDDDNQNQIDLRINYEDVDENDTYEELISFAELEKLKQKLEEKKSPKKIKLISPGQFEYVDYEEKIDHVNNNSIDVIGIPRGLIDVDSCPIDKASSKCKIEDGEGKQLFKPDNQLSSEIEVEMEKLSVLDICDANKQSIKFTPIKSSKNANDCPAEYDSKGRKLLGYLKSLDNLKDPKESAYPVTDRCYLGRLPSCQVVIDGPKVSRVHATIYKTVDGIFLQTLSKTNGCCVNNSIIGTDNFIRIVNGDTVTIGGTPFVWIENGGRDEKAINKVKKEGEEMEIEMVEKDLDGETIKHQGDSTKKNKSKLNVAAVLEASLKKMEKLVPSGQIFVDSGIASDVPMLIPDLSVPPPSGSFQMLKINNQDTNIARGDNIHQSASSESPTPKHTKHSLPNLSVPPPNVEILVAIPPPNTDIPTQKKEENKLKYDLPKVQHNVKTPKIQFHTQMLNKKNLKSKRPQSASRSALDGEKLIPPSPGKQSSSEMEVFSVNIASKWEENTRHDKRDFFTIKMPKKLQEIDDVVIESERFITD